VKNQNRIQASGFLGTINLIKKMICAESAFLNPGPDRSPTLYTRKVMFVMVHWSDQDISDAHQGGL
jgi:hypothetical protein